MIRTLANLAGFQLVWLAAVAGAANGLWWAGPSALLLFAGVQLAGSEAPRLDAKLMLACGVLGFAVDSAWVQLGWIDYASPGSLPVAAPAWIVAIWMAFGLTVNHSLSGLKSRPAAAAALGLVGGPLAYWVAADVWHAATVTSPIAAYAALGLSWSVIAPTLLRLTTQWQRTPSAVVARAG